MKLGQVAGIKTGLVLTRKKAEVDYDVKAQYRLVTLKNISLDGTFSDEAFELFQSNDELDADHFTQVGDILVRLSHPYTTVYIQEEQQGLLIPSYFAVIRLYSSVVAPAFVAWYLNTERVKNELLKHQTGTNIPTTNKSALAQVDIPRVPIEKQRMIIELNALHQKEIGLYQQLIKEKQKLNTLVTYTIANIS
ncbi:hypothetical protein Alches_12510 [Alicyclobacillus hesperidum subsp. aegles]|uniref:Type I restriction modification DNA specificity domain-containing protein n=1 Tax=Alicyclobacillus tolerans TaxID=90970 RepID=A0A1M6LNF5_9BACL|nr:MULTISPECIES: restriction endonuclease subunit S [Alicyclobacillus]GLG01212.1 hypothetical protein Alches_12510 [Alicyclobacillus hesperidum subsp. aegles]SHJ72632.1 hypothetical protein SAMN05443507_10327 [Alicyclobacillus montanus]